jgi:pseudaminic acid biosynthesis-associated methylase
MNRRETEQERFWAGSFGDEYRERNQARGLVASNLHLFSTALARTTGVRSVLELGANIGLNLKAVHQLLPEAELSAVEINAQAASELEGTGICREVHRGSLLDHEADAPHDLVFTKGVLIHLAPDSLPLAYDVIHRSSGRYILLAEYYNPAPVEVPYRGHEGRLFKRDFAGELMARYDDVRLIDYGFAYRHDPVFPADDITWFLMQRGA